MFEIERRSNTGSLILAVMVGVLSLVSNQYAKVRPETLAALIPDVTEIVDQEHEAVNEPPSDMEELRARVNYIDATLSRHFFAYMAGRRSPNDAKMLRSISMLGPYTDRIEEVSEDFTIVEQMTLLRLLFMAAQLDRETFGPAFSQLCSRVEDSGDEKLATQAGVLRFYFEHDLSQPNIRELLSALDQFSQRHRDPISGIRLYSIVSQELWRVGQSEGAEEVLRRGIRRFDGEPDVSRLVNQMIDQRTPPRLGRPRR